MPGNCFSRDGVDSTQYSRPTRRLKHYMLIIRAGGWQDHMVLQRGLVAKGKSRASIQAYIGLIQCKTAVSAAGDFDIPILQGCATIIQQVAQAATGLIVHRILKMRAGGGYPLSDGLEQSVSDALRMLHVA